MLCVALFFLKTDGLDKNWNQGVKSYWEECINREDNNQIPFAVSRLNHPTSQPTPSESDYK